MKTEKDDFLLGLIVFLVVLESKNTIKAKKNNAEIFLIGGFASEKISAELALLLLFTQPPPPGKYPNTKFFLTACPFFLLKFCTATKNFRQNQFQSKLNLANKMFLSMHQMNRN